MKFLYNAPAVLHYGALIIGDTHFGMEAKLRGKGIYDENISERIVEKIEKLLKETKAEKLIIAGDVKENILETDKKTLEILKSLSGITELIIVKGNHDGGIEKCGLSGVEVVSAEGFVYKKVGVVHGHSWPGKDVMKCDYIISAHQHPQIMMEDRSGKIHREAAWLIAEPDVKKIGDHYENFNKNIKLVLIPAFNPLVGSIIDISEKRRLGPILNNKLFKLNDALVVKLDGCFVGKLKNIKSDPHG